MYKKIRLYVFSFDLIPDVVEYLNANTNRILSKCEIDENKFHVEIIVILPNSDKIQVFKDARSLSSNIADGAFTILLNPKTLEHSALVVKQLITIN